jgi:hypothetical protein
MPTFRSLHTPRPPSLPPPKVGLDESFKLSERSHYFFFVLSDCSLEFYDAKPPALDYKLHVLNSGSELPVIMHTKGQSAASDNAQFC